MSRVLSRREALGTMAASLAIAAGSARADAPPANVVLLISDEHNPRYAAPYGMPGVHTPNMDRLARAGTVYERAYCPSPLCMPSRSAFMSGQPVHRLHTYSNCNLLMDDHDTYGKVLAAEGVHTVHVGKTDVFRPGAALGFSEMILPGDRRAPGDTFISHHPLSIRTDGAERADAYGPQERPFAGDDQKADAAIEWLQKNGKTLGKPWVLSVNLIKPHFPHYVTPELWETYAKLPGFPPYGMDEATAQHPYCQDHRRHFQTENFSAAQIEGLRRGYLGCISYVDQQLGRILDTLEAQGLRENTVVAYTSDHGDMLGKFGMWWKCSLLEDAVRVPLIVAGPGFRAGTRVQTPVELHDLQAAVFRATGNTRPAAWRGTPLQDIPENDPQRVAFSEYHGHGVRAGGYMIRKGDWKLVWCAEAPHLLFNLREDPEELHNRCEDQPDKFRELEAELRRICDPEKENAVSLAFQDRQLQAALA